MLSIIPTCKLIIIYCQVVWLYALHNEKLNPVRARQPLKIVKHSNKSSAICRRIFMGLALIGLKLSASQSFQFLSVIYTSRSSLIGQLIHSVYQLGCGLSNWKGIFQLESDSVSGEMGDSVIWWNTS